MWFCNPNNIHFPMFSSREIGLGAKDFQWKFGLSDELPLDLVFEVGAVEAHLDLRP